MRRRAAAAAAAAAAPRAPPAARSRIPHPRRASALDMSEDEEALYANCFAPLGFRRAQFSRLLRLGTFVRAADDKPDVLTVQGEPILDLFVPLNGTVEVRVGGAVASTLNPYDLVGEASLLENLQSPGGEEHPPARATVVAAPGCWYVRWPQSVFYELQMEEDSDFGYAIQLMIARTLSAKLATKRESQRESEARLEGRLAARLRGYSPGDASAPAASPMALAAKRLEAQAEPPGTGRALRGAAAEVKALLQKNRDKEAQVLVMQRSLEKARTELADLKFLIAFAGGGGAIAIVLASLLAILPTDWWWEAFAVGEIVKMQ